MWKQRPVSAFLHEVFGLTQSPAEALGTLVFGVAAVVLLSSLAETPASLPLWRWALGWLLVADVAAGCAANFTRGTNMFYAQRPGLRWVFIAIHVHLPAVAWLLENATSPAWVVWAFTVAGAAVVNLFAGRPYQVFVGGVLWATGLLLVFALGTQWSGAWMMAVAALFLTKVLFAFAVQHHPAPSSGPG